MFGVDLGWVENIKQAVNKKTIDAFKNETYKIYDDYQIIADKSESEMQVKPFSRFFDDNIVATKFKEIDRGFEREQAVKMWAHASVLAVFEKAEEMGIEKDVVIKDIISRHKAFSHLKDEDKDIFIDFVKRFDDTQPERLDTEEVITRIMNVAVGTFDKEDEYVPYGKCKVGKTRKQGLNAYYVDWSNKAGRAVIVRDYFEGDMRKYIMFHELQHQIEVDYRKREDKILIGSKMITSENPDKVDIVQEVYTERNTKAMFTETEYKEISPDTYLGELEVADKHNIKVEINIKNLGENDYEHFDVIRENAYVIVKLQENKTEDLKKGILKVKNALDVSGYNSEEFDMIERKKAIQAGLDSNLVDLYYTASKMYGNELENMIEEEDFEIQNRVG